MKPLLIIDNAIPFLEGRLDRDFDCRILRPAEISPDAVKDAKGLLVRTRTRCNAGLLEGSSVDFVATGTIGMDHFDIPYLESRHIDWQNAPGCNAPAVAQYVWRALAQLGFDPKSHTLGVVGKGNVGSIVTEWGRKLGAEVLVCDPPRKDAGFSDEEYLQLDELMSRADAVTFHTPLLKSTHHLAGREMLEKLRRGAIIINAARGGVIDEAALEEIMEKKGLKVAIDTWEGEPRLNRRMLEKADIATFHIAGYSRQGKERASYAILSGLERHFGVSLDKSGLTGPYRSPDNLTLEAIRESYDIMADDAEFRRRPEDFESLRDNYQLREELQ
ncbi:MAG: 4-phosphoerythronate dehydrogenase [Muribaculaceae bacterium]|nr:4-phosphoerythronate dehydrogenase [Muribaculaceae bacterium]